MFGPEDFSRGDVVTLSLTCGTRVKGRVRTLGQTYMQIITVDGTFHITFDRITAAGSI